jgi:lipid-A-disaccharide synthase
VTSGLRILAVAGEVSGDHQGGRLAAALRRRRPDVAVLGVGGAEMAAAGVDVLVDSTRWGVIGYVETYIRLPVYLVRFLSLIRLIDRLRPDLLLLIDFPGMNRELVRHYSGRIPMVYFFPPHTYGRRGRSAARMAQARVRLLAVLPFEAEAYRRAGADVVYVGHPAVDAADAVAASREPLRQEWAAGGGPLIGLLPGSRTQEVRTLLPPMLEAAGRAREKYSAQFVLPLAAPHLRRDVEKNVARSGVPVRLVDGRALDVMAAADALIVASGTAPVEAACVGVPMVVVYRLSRLTEWIVRRFVAPPDVGREGLSIPSITVGRPIIPELIQDDVNGTRISAEVDRLFDSTTRARIRADLAEVRRRLGPPGVLDRATAETLRVLDSRAAGTLR